MCIKMIRILIIFISSVLILGADGQGLICSTSWESSCPSATPLVSGPTCPDGFDLVDDHCFKVSEEKEDWNESKIKCEEINANLAEPREPLNSTAFLNYLLQNVDFDNTDETFSMGGKLSNDIWKWLTGGKISHNISPDYETDYSYGFFNSPETVCLAIEVSGNKNELSQSKISWKGIDCTTSRKRATQPGLRTYRYVCQATREYSYSTCEYNGTTYPSGQLVSINLQQCQQDWCQDGDIQQYTCGDITTGCCEQQGQLYGNGDIIGPDCNDCQHQVCQAGVIQWQGSTKCCLFDGEAYQPGSHILNSCARLVCDGNTGQFNLQGIDDKCPTCEVFWDPHIVTYDQKTSYGYQGCGSYILSQIGNTYHPAMAIYATFVDCGDRVSCVDTVTFKNDDHTVITIRGKHPDYKIEVNGEKYTIPSSSPSIVQVMNTTYPVVAWKSDVSWKTDVSWGFGCVNFQGSSGILVKFCGSYAGGDVYVWADSNVSSELNGLCGTVNDDDFSARNGTIISPWQKNPPMEFFLSWLTSVTGNAKCDGTKSRVKRQAQNDCETNTSVIEEYQDLCKMNVNFPNAEPEKLKTLIDDCVYDLCNVTNPNEWIRAVRETVKVQADIQENTFNFTDTTTVEPDTTTVEPYTKRPNKPKDNAKKSPNIMVNIQQSVNMN